MSEHAICDPFIFRSYDIRGVVGKTLTIENVLLIGQALGSLAQENNENKIFVARDGRFSGLELSRALSAGIQSSGCDVIDIGMVPTPLLYYATHVGETHSGVMVTGSHNPAQYNGLKMVIQGVALTEVEIKQLYHRITEKRFRQGRGLRFEKDFRYDYIQEMVENIHLARPLTIVVDAGNGVTGEFAPQVFKALGCKVHELFCDIDGSFPHHQPDPSQAANLQTLRQVVKEKQADLGLAFDGDGDRIGVVTRAGHIIEADRLLMLFAKNILSQQPDAKIIYDIKCTQHLAELINAQGGQAILCKTGHSFVKAKLMETHAQLAGEMSGHLFFKDKWYGFDDAIYAGARLLELLAETSGSSDDLFCDMPKSVNTPELRVSVSDENKFSIMQQLIAAADFQENTHINLMDGIRVSFNEGWGLVRPSNTMPYLVLRFEAINEPVLKNIQSIFRDWMLSVMPELELPF